jgi:uncharacterized protein (DUF1697 family)
VRNFVLITIATLIFQVSYSQSPVDFSKFPTSQGDTATLGTKELLTKINWEGIKDFCRVAQGHYVYEEKDSLLKEYRYLKQGYEAHFEITSYRNMVLEYHVDAGNQKPVSYFNKNLWLKFVDEMLPSLPDQFKLAKEEPTNIAKTYYGLMGINPRSEYGFICEYNTAGMPPPGRMAIVVLLKQHRIDLIKKLADSPNLQAKLYAIDALIYIDYMAKENIRTLEKDIQKKEDQLQRLQKKNADQIKIGDLKNQISRLSDSAALFKRDQLSDSDWQMIHDLRDSNQKVRTCGNMGSYKIYLTPISELLSEKAIANIPKAYQLLKGLGYFW